MNILARKPSTVEERSDAIVNKLEVLDQRLASKVTSFISHEDWEVGSLKADLHSTICCMQFFCSVGCLHQTKIVNSSRRITLYMATIVVGF